MAWTFPRPQFSLSSLLPAGPRGPILLPVSLTSWTLLVLTPSPLAGLPALETFLQRLLSGTRSFLLSLGLSLLLLVGVCVIGSQSEGHRVGREERDNGVRWWGHWWRE